uniref:Large ribosomal RNA subunit accumulation protein YceD n=2 Tax=Candidatus Berkiella cookevillensis TaxID=437022 RepID=A0A0Q9YTN6_9GAMM
MQARRYYCRLMLPNELPKIINPLKLCQDNQKGHVLTANVFVSELTGLGLDNVQPADRVLTVALEFGIDAEGIPTIEGHFSGSLLLTCQRCLEAFDYQISQDICVSPVISIEAAKELPEQYEPLLLNDETISLLAWLTEELHLALPMTPKHTHPCALVQPKEAEIEKTEEEKIFPFKNLMNDLDKT